MLEYLIAALGCAYLTFGVVHKSDPLGILPRLRSLGSEKTNPLRCLFCASFWMGQAFSLLFAANLPFPKLFALGLCFAFISSYLGLLLLPYSD